MTHRSTPPRALPLSPGDVVEGKFRVEGLLGEGGMGLVVAATHLFLRERVALKFLRPELLAYPELVARFAFEARAAVKVKSEHVARVLDVGEVGGVPFMVLEHLEGKNLGSWVAQHGPLSLREAAEYLIQVCSALAEVHSLGIVHRDVKPENLFLVERGGYRFVKLIDFGISKAPEPMPPSERGESRSAATEDEMALLETGELMGSPSYMAPEQLTQTRLDARTDIWALGAVLYELLTGTPLFDPYRPLPEIVSAVLQGPIPSLMDKRPDLPLAIVGVLARCLSRDRDLRFQSAAELAVALLPFAPRRSREAAERAVSHVRSTGHSEPRIALPRSEAPPASPVPARAYTPTASEVDPLFVALGEDATDYRAALRPAPVPQMANATDRSEPKTVRIVRAKASLVPRALDSAPATAHSVEPPTAARRRPGRVATVSVALAAACAAGFVAVVRLGLPIPLPTLAAEASEQPALASEQHAPSVLVSLEAAAEPSFETFEAFESYDAAARARRASPCDNPYESERCLER